MRVFEALTFTNVKKDKLDVHTKRHIFIGYTKRVSEYSCGGWNLGKKDDKEGCDI